MTVYCDNLMKQINILVLFTKEHMHTLYPKTARARARAHTHTHTHTHTRLNKYMFWTRFRVFMSEQNDEVVRNAEYTECND